MTLLSVMIATMRFVAPHAREQRVDLVDAADQRGPVLPELLAFGRIGLGGNHRMYAAALAPGFRCVDSDGGSPAAGRGNVRGLLRAGLGFLLVHLVHHLVAITSFFESALRMTLGVVLLCTGLTRDEEARCAAGRK